MPNWQRRLIGVLTLGGGAVGITLVIETLFRGKLQAVGLIVALIVGLLYSWGVVCGVLLLEDSHRAIPFAKPYWLIQILQVHTPWISYACSSGARLYIQLALISGDVRLHFNAGVGSAFDFHFQNQIGWIFGLNVVALLVFVALKKSGRAAA